MAICVHTAPVLKVAQLYRKLITSFIGIAAEGIIILPKMNLIIVIAVKSGLTYYAVSTNNSILNQTDQEHAQFQTYRLSAVSTAPRPPSPWRT